MPTMSGKWQQRTCPRWALKSCLSLSKVIFPLISRLNVIPDLKDAEGYLDAIGQEQTANIKSKATIEKAEADRDAFIQEQECSKNAMDKKYQVDTSIADFEKEFKTKEVFT